MDTNGLAALVANILQQQLPTILQQVQQQQQLKNNQVVTPPLSRSSSVLSRSSSGLSRSSSGVSVSSSGFTTPTSQSTPRSLSPPPRPDKHNSPAIDLLGGSDDDEESQIGASAAFEEQQASDRRRVRKPVLRKLDAKYLAPLKSQLFKRFYCKQRNSDGSRKLKKNQDMDEQLFKHLVRPVLRRLLGHDPMGAGVHMVQRLYRAAKIVAKKRRANHVQCWRTNGTCKKLIYGGTLPANVAAAASRRAMSVVKSEPGVEQPKPKEQPKSIPEEKPIDSESKNSSGPKKFQRKTSCCDCGEKIEFNSYFEQDHEDWATGCASEHVRCSSCFDKFVQREVVPNHHGRLVNKRKPKNSSPDSPYHFVEPNKENTPEPKEKTPKPKEKEDTPEPVTQKKRQRKKRTQCKCGSKTHLTVRSKHCPLNKKNAKTVTTEDPKPQSSDEDESSDPPTTQKLFSVGDNVKAMWEPQKWFLSHVYSVTPTGYGVFCPVTGATKNVKVGEVRQLSASAKIQNPTRADLVNRNAEFIFDGDKDIPPGRWKVRRCLHEKNQFVCVRLSDAPVGTPNVDNFMIHYVVKGVRELEETEREGAFINSRRR